MHRLNLNPALIQSGHNYDERINLFLSDSTSKGLGVDSISIETQANAKAAMATLETALTTISNQLARVGAYQNRLKHSISAQTIVEKESKIAFGRIMDADIPKESTNLSRAEVMAKANAAMLAHANNSLGTILSVFN